MNSTAVSILKKELGIYGKRSTTRQNDGCTVDRGSRWRQSHCYTSINEKKTAVIQQKYI